MTTRRDMLAGGAALAALAATPVRAKAQATARPTIGIQISPESFVDEGVETVIDRVQGAAAVNTLYLATYANNNGSSGRQIPGQPFPDHGRPLATDDADYRGGYFARVDPRYFGDTSLTDIRAQENGDFDILAGVVPQARRRGLRTVALMTDNWRTRIVGGEALTERDLDGVSINSLCFNNPDAQGFLRGLVANTVATAPELDGVFWRTERTGPMSRVLGVGHQDNFRPGAAGCFCVHCERLAGEEGINVARVRLGYAALADYAAQASSGAQIVDGAHAAFWRLLFEHPGILAWEKFQAEGVFRLLAMLRRAARAERSDIEFSSAVGVLRSYNPFYRAWAEIGRYAEAVDALKVPVYHNVVGERLPRFVDNLTRTFQRGVPPAVLQELTYGQGGFDGPGYETSIQSGMPVDYVTAEVRNLLAAADGTQLKIHAGIDAGLPVTEPGSRRVEASDLEAAVRAAFAAEADGVILSRKYSEMSFSVLAGAGRAVRGLGLA